MGPVFWAWCAIISACTDRGLVDTLTPVTLGVETVATGLSSPVFLASPAGDARLFVVEQPGRIRIIKSGQVLGTPFLDITPKVLAGGERGLLSVAFHPSYASNGFFFVYFTNRSGDIQVERYQVSANADVADDASAKLIIIVPHPDFGNHNGGLLRFGLDGMLYMGTGDGGSGGDPSGNGQNRNTLLGKLLRLDVDGGDPYAIPSNNPFVGSGRGEIWAYGLRNPWRYAFDRTEGLLYIADVGQNAWEEVHVATASEPGINYGWKIMEGRHCYGAATCSQQGLMLPVVEYNHSDGCSITGGSVYRGVAIPEIVGHYFYSDFCNGWLRSFRYSDGQVRDPQEWPVSGLGGVMSFGEDAQGELYILSSNGRVLRIVKR